MSVEKVLMEILLGGGGAGAIVAYLWSKIEKVWRWAAGLDLTAKRVMIGILCFAVVQVFYWAAIWFSLIAMPDTPQTWFVDSFPYATFAFAGGTYWHGFLDDGSDPRKAF